MPPYDEAPRSVAMDAHMRDLRAYCASARLALHNAHELLKRVDDNAASDGMEEEIGRLDADLIRIIADFDIACLRHSLPSPKEER